MKFLILTYANDDMKEMVEVTSANKKKYCDKYGYDFVRETEMLENLGYGRGKYSWNKIPLLIKYLPHYDWIFWSDADALIMNYNRRLEEFVPHENGKDLIIARDHQPWINAGNFFIRDCEWSRNFLQLVRLHTWVEKMGPQYGWWEQGAIRYLIEQPYHEAHVKYVSCREFNAYANLKRREWEYNGWMREDLFKPGDFLCHYSGLVHQDGVSHYNLIMSEMKKAMEKIK